MTHGRGAPSPGASQPPPAEVGASARKFSGTRWGTLPAAGPRALTEVTGADCQEHLGVAAGPAGSCRREQGGGHQAGHGCAWIQTCPAAGPLHTGQHPKGALISGSASTTPGARVTPRPQCAGWGLTAGTPGPPPSAGRAWPHSMVRAAVPHEQLLDSVKSFRAQHQRRPACAEQSLSFRPPEPGLPSLHLRSHSPRCQGRPLTRRLLLSVPPATSIPQGVEILPGRTHEAAAY